MTPEQLAERGIRIKPLAWRKDAIGGIFVKTIFGRYDIRQRFFTGNDAYRLWGLIYGQAGTEAELQAAAEADHAARVCAMLEVEEARGLA